ncbi:ABC transporter substrate-binding protein [Roseomonas sp. 18066]|uniref:ABC transporter substrate-binding protein n=1 Tax=Roseomonas sp. 18066 TaxID=2681412 RepID=UPI0013574AF4|nr:ABC transporter substrate-binding protein [Roseomonas sp. 18066]
MTQADFSLSRRSLLGASLAGAALYAGGLRDGLAAPRRGGTLVVGQYPEPPMLTVAFASSGPGNNITPKIFDGLLTYDHALRPQPQLAESWETAEDGLSLTFRLRAGVRWHDGAPFTAEDVRFSLWEVWRKLLARGQTTFAAVRAVEVPDPLTVVLRLSTPAPYILNGLASHLAQILPRHLYEGSDIARNPANLAPIGTGPFRFVRWERGSHLRLERNPDYWDSGKPYLDQVIFRFLPDAAGRAAALESGDVQLVAETGIPGSDLVRLARDPAFTVERRGYNYIAPITFLAFNLDRKPFDDVRVRRAIAHAIDRDFLLRHVWYGYGQVATGPLPQGLSSFYSADVPLYPYDPARARALLDEAGLAPDARGIRLSFTHDSLPYGEQYQRTGEYLRDALARIGIRVELRAQDYASYVRRIYTARDFDTANYLISVGPDPAIGAQRLYWSKGFAPGVAFSNATHYANPEVDRLLEAAQVEVDPVRRRALYAEFQRQAQDDLSQIPLIAIDQVTVASAALRDHSAVAEGPKASFAAAFLGR